MASRSATTGNRARIRRLALCCTLLAAGGALPLPVQAKDAAGLVMTIGEPDEPLFAGL